MTTNFALSLSFEGIELLHRVQHGWKRVGRADVEDENLDAVLADLRTKAEALAPGGLYTKLIIPLDQIKYVAIDSTQTTLDDIHAELDGATPYALDELVIDCERFGGRTHIAAVARETLVEAETFAHAHGFNPVSFVAVPEPFTFQKEVFFGPTSMMQDILGPDGEVERDPLPVMIVGTRIKSRLLVFDLPEDVIPPSDDFDLADALAEADKTATPPAPADIEDEPPSEGFDLAAALAPFADDAPAKDEPAVEQPLLPLEMDAPEASDTKAPEEDQPEPEAEEPVAEKTDIPADPEPVAVETEDVATDTPPPIENAPAEVDAPIAMPLAKPRLFDRIIAEVAAPVIAPDPVMVTQDEVPDAATAPEPVAIPSKLSLAKPPLFDPVISEYYRPSLRRVRRHRSRLIALPPPTKAVAAAAKPAPVAPKPSQPAVAANTDRRPVMIAGVIAASLALVGVIAWSTLRNADPVTPADPVAAAVEDAMEETVATTAATTAAAPIDDVEVTGPAPARPQIDVTDFDVRPDEDADAGIAVDALDAPQTAAAPQALAAGAAPDALPGPVQPAPAPPAEEQAVASVGAPVLRGRVLSPADAARIYEATGVWQRAPRFVDVPGTTSTDGLIVPFSETVPDRAVQPEVPLANDLATDLSFLAPADPPPADVAFPLDDDGFILATPEGTLTPEGAVVIAGAPDLTLRLRPDLTEADLARMALLAPAPEGVVIIAGRPDIIPPLRPADAALPTPEDDTAAIAAEDAPTPGGVALSSLQSDTAPVAPTPDPAERPEPRPSDLASTARPADPGTPDITSIIAEIEAEDAANAFAGATPQAVVASLRPELRPNNFDRVVAAARARQQSQQAAPAPAAPVRAAAPVAPQNYTPVPGGVARAATQEDVIRLREMNLIGVYGRPNARRALVRLSNGRYVRVEVGSALDGGQVTAIGEAALNYVKRGRTYALELPSG